MIRDEIIEKLQEFINSEFYIGSNEFQGVDAEEILSMLECHLSFEYENDTYEYENDT